MTVFVLTIRQLLSGKRWLVLAVVLLLPVFLAIAVKSATNEPMFLQDAFPGMVIGVIVPIIALLLAGSAFASDVEEGTAVFVLAKPVSRTVILLERYAASALLAIVCALVSGVLSMQVYAGTVERFSSLLIANSAALAFGAALYSALFLALSFLTRRGIIVGLLYVLVWESALASQFAGTRTLSVKEYMLTIASVLDKSGVAQHSTTITSSTALTMGAVLAVLALLYSLRRLRNFELTGGE